MMVTIDPATSNNTPRASRTAVSGLALATVGAAGLVAMRALLPASTPPVRQSRGSGAMRSVAGLEKVHIGGVDQWVLQRSEDVRNPIVLFLHGGPGTSQLTTNRRNTRDLERCFTVVTWDQRGAGKSYGAIRDADAMSIDRFVEDTRELTQYLLDKYDQEQIVLVGHSWGSIIGALTVSRHPELYAAYVGVGQVANMAMGEAESYRWTLEQAKQRDDRKAIAALEAIGPPPYTGDWRGKTITERRYVARFGGEVHKSRNGAMRFVLGGLLFSSEYTLADRANYFRGILESMRLLWPQLMDVDLFTAVPKLEVPVFLVEGRHDHEVPADIAEQYFHALEAPSKELIWFEESGHLPNTEERDRFNRFMIERVLPFATGRER